MIQTRTEKEKVKSHVPGGLFQRSKHSPLERILSELQGEDQLTAEKVIASALVSGEDAEVKTEIRNPLAMSAIDVAVEWLKDEFGDGSEVLLTEADVADLFGSWYRINMISFDRKSRDEVVKAVSKSGAIETDKRSLKERLIEH